MTVTKPSRRALVVADIRAYAAELADSHLTQTPAYTKTRGGRIKLVGVHRVEQDGLLAQLAEAAVLGTTSSDDVHGARPIPQSRPPGAWEAIGRHAAITLAVVGWTWELRLPQRDTVQANVRQLAAAAAVPRLLDDIGARMLLTAMRSWRVQAQTAAGWITPLFAPRATCPILTCGERGTLRVNLAKRSAYCTACEAIWDDSDSSIKVLADHIATETGNAEYRGEPVRSGRAGHGAWLNAPTVTG